MSDFHFSQASLQDYVDCRRKFLLRHLWRLAWPAIEVEPILERERFLRLGSTFHRMVQQHILGVPENTILRIVKDVDLMRWWKNYIEYPVTPLPNQRLTEILISAPLAGHRLVAKYDLIAIDPGRRTVIVDWKTTHRRPSSAFLAERLQTRIYRYLLIQGGAHFNQGKPIKPEQVEMVYWFSDYPEEPEHFSYSEEAYQGDAIFLNDLIEEIVQLGETEFTLTSNERMCRYCPYRSLCQRGIRAGKIDDWMEETEEDESLDFELDFDQIAEVEF